MLVNPASADRKEKKASIKKKIMSCRLDWSKITCCGLRIYIIFVKNKLCVSPESKFNMASCLFSGKKLEEWTTAEKTVTSNLIVDLLIKI